MLYGVQAVLITGMQKSKWLYKILTSKSYMGVEFFVLICVFRCLMGVKSLEMAIFIRLA